MKRVVSGCEPGDIVTVIDEILLWIFLQHQESFPFHVSLKENSFQTNQKLITWHLWFILLNPPSLLCIALPCVQSKADLQGGSLKLGTESVPGKGFASKGWQSPLKAGKLLINAEQHGASLIAASEAALWMVPCEGGGEPGGGGMWVRGRERLKYPPLSR